MLCNFDVISLSAKKPLLFSDVILRFSMSEFSLFSDDVMVVFQWAFPLILFQTMFGLSIYRHFCDASIYCFSRRNNRISWFFKELLSMSVNALIFLISELAGGLLLTLLNHKIIFNKASWFLLLYYLAIYFMWLIFTSLLINLISIKSTSTVGFTSVVGVELAYIVLFFFIKHQMVDLDKTGKKIIAAKQYLFRINPFAHLNLSWHTSKNQLINKYISAYKGINFDLNFTLITFFILCVITIIAGCIIVKNVEFINSSREES